MTNGSRNVLGRGISALIPTGPQNERPGYFDCPVERIRPQEGQPRQLWNDQDLADLTASIESNGVIQPLIVRRQGSDYVLIAGERRWRAAQAAGLQTVPVVVKESMPAEDFVLALVENVQRADLHPLEVAEACRRLIEEQGLSQEEVARRIGKQRSTVTNMLRLLRLGPEARSALAEGSVTEGHARSLVNLAPEAQAATVASIISEGLSVRQTEARVRQGKAPAPPQTEADGASLSSTPASLPPAVPLRDEKSAVASWQENTPHGDDLISRARALLAARLDTVVQIHLTDRERGRGRIEIPFGAYAELEALLEHLGLDRQS